MWRMPLIGLNAEVLPTAMSVIVSGLVFHLFSAAYVNTLLLGHKVAKETSLL